MTKRNHLKLSQSYRKYRRTKPSQSKLMEFFRGFMPEIIFRTTKLEGERVTRKMTKALFP